MVRKDEGDKEEYFIIVVSISRKTMGKNEGFVNDYFFIIMALFSIS